MAALIPAEECNRIEEEAKNKKIFAATGTTAEIEKKEVSYEFFLNMN